MGKSGKATTGLRPIEEIDMSKDEKITKELMGTLEDGRLGYDKAAELLSEDHPVVAARMTEAAKHQFEMYTELQKIASTYGDSVEESGSVGAVLHRGWLVVKDLLTGDSIEAVLNAAITGEKHSIELYEKALSEDLSATFRPVLQRQLSMLKASLVELEQTVDGVKS
jgi:uncharacterized protein (TIGR02284 family)